MGVINTVDFHQIFQEHEDHIGEKARLLTEISVLKEIKNLSGQTLKVLIILEYFCDVQFAHLFAKALSWLGHNVGLHAGVHIVLHVD